MQNNFPAKNKERVNSTTGWEKAHKKPNGAFFFSSISVRRPFDYFYSAHFTKSTSTLLQLC